MQDIKVKRLSEVRDGTDIHELSPCIYPGGHCPLFGVHLTLDTIVGVTMLIVGTNDCGFYAFKTMKNYQRRNEKSARIVCGVLDEHDVINGCSDDLKRIIRELDDDPATKMIVIVTSCVIELIGEDIEGTVLEIQGECRKPITIIRTENFKTADYTKGIELSLEAVTALLEKQPVIPRSYAVLGPRFPGVRGSSICRRLENEGFSLLVEFPVATDWDSMTKLTQAEFSIVTDHTALGLAKKLKDIFGIAYVDLSPVSSHDNLRTSYAELAKVSGIPFEKDIEAFLSRNAEIRNRLATAYSGRKFVVGNTVGTSFHASAIIAEIGGIIEMILARNVYDTDKHPITDLLKRGQDPLVVKNANMSALENSLADMEADYYIGMRWTTADAPNLPEFIPIRTMTPLIGTDYWETYYKGLLDFSNKKKGK